MFILSLHIIHYLSFSSSLYIASIGEKPPTLGGVVHDHFFFFYSLAYGGLFTHRLDWRRVCIRSYTQQSIGKTVIPELALAGSHQVS